jgi:hypothetical protein
MHVHAVRHCGPKIKLNDFKPALALLFYFSGHGFLFQSCSIGNPQYAPEVWHKTPGTLYIIRMIKSRKMR